MKKTVEIGRFSTRIDADLARLRLTTEGIHAVVVEHHSAYPPLNASSSAIRLAVGEADVERAEALLETPLLEESDSATSYRAHANIEEADGPDVVRCPRCELEYCFFERPRAFAPIRGAGPVLRELLALALLPVLFLIALKRKLSPPRWHCHKCEYVWDDLAECPREKTPVAAGDPRPVFRLRRSTPGPTFIGVCVGILGLALIEDELWGWFVFMASAVLGQTASKIVRTSSCSEPTCRADLKPSDTTCGKCKGHVAGEIDEAPQHYAEVTAFRRELARSDGLEQERPRRMLPRRAPRKKRRSETSE